MHLWRKTTGIEPSYFMNGKPIEVVCFEKDLGVVFSNDMKVALHCSDSYRKANRMLGMISRTITYRHPTVLLNLYKTSLLDRIWIIAHLFGIHTTSRTLNCLSESNIDSLVCFLNFEANCHMMIDFASLVFGLFGNVATELISLNFSNG